MNNENNENFPQPPQNSRPSIEDEFKAKLGGEELKNALGFIAYMRAGGMTTSAEQPNRFWYHGRNVCILIIHPIDGKTGWTICDNPLTGQYDDFPASDKLKEFAWAHVNICTSCGGSSGCGKQPGRSKFIFAKNFDNVCTSEVAFRNPDAETLKTIMQMIDIWKLHIDSEKNNGE